MKGGRNIKGVNRHSRDTFATSIHRVLSLTIDIIANYLGHHLIIVLGIRADARIGRDRGLQPYPHPVYVISREQPISLSFPRDCQCRLACNLCTIRMVEFVVLSMISQFCNLFPARTIWVTKAISGTPTLLTAQRIAKGCSTLIKPSAK